MEMSSTSTSFNKVLERFDKLEEKTMIIEKELLRSQEEVLMLKKWKFDATQAMDRMKKSAALLEEDVKQKFQKINDYSSSFKQDLENVLREVEKKFQEKKSAAQHSSPEVEKKFQEKKSTAQHLSPELKEVKELSASFQQDKKNIFLQIEKQAQQSKESSKKIHQEMDKQAKQRKEKIQKLQQQAEDCVKAHQELAEKLEKLQEAFLSEKTAKQENDIRKELDVLRSSLASLQLDPGSVIATPFSPNKVIECGIKLQPSISLSEVEAKWNRVNPDYYKCYGHDTFEMFKSCDKVRLPQRDESRCAINNYDHVLVGDALTERNYKVDPNKGEAIFPPGYRYFHINVEVSQRDFGMLYWYVCGDEEPRRVVGGGPVVQRLSKSGVVYYCSLIATTSSKGDLKSEGMGVSWKCSSNAKLWVEVERQWGHAEAVSCRWFGRW